MQSCTFRELGAGGIGVGNDKNAHFTGIGLGADNINISDNYFTQVMGNSITVGGIQADAHHPSEPEMLLSHIHVSNNVFNNNSALWSSTVPILFTYTQFSSIAHNDIYNHPYSGIFMVMVRPVLSLASETTNKCQAGEAMTQEVARNILNEAFTSTSLSTTSPQ
jgi:hypothetical protein